MADVLCPIVVGREAELRTLAERLTAAAAGRGGCVFITGEAGIGKSRLVHEISADAENQGLVVAAGRAVPSGASVAYRPLAEALLQALRALPLREDADLEAWRPALGAIVPGFATGAGGAEASAPVRGEAVIQLLRRLAPPGGLVVALEDLHWADPDTIAIVEYLSDNIGSTPVLCIVTARSEPASPALALARRQRSRRGVIHIPLDRLDAAQTAVMVAACVPDPAAGVAARVFREAEGVPLLVEEVLASPGVPHSFADTVRERLTGFPPEERLVIEAAAVLGRDFGWELLAPMTGQPAGAVSASLARGVDCLLLSADSTAVRFRHALTREAVLAGLLPPRHRELAAAALAALDQAHPRLDDDWGDLAADLAARSGDRARAGVLLTASGRLSLRRGALATAIGTLRRAAGLLDGDARQAGTELAVVEALTLAGRVDEAAAAGARLIGRLGHDPATLSTRVEIHLLLAHAAVAASGWPMAGQHVASAHDLAGTGPQPALRARITMLEAEIAFAADDTGRAHHLATAVLGTAGASPEARCHALEIIGRAERFGDLAAARAAFERALDTAEAADLPIWRLRALHELGTIDMFDHAGTKRLSQARAAAGQSGALSTAAVLDLQLAATFTSRWQLDEADAHARSSLAVAERLGLRQIQAVAMAELAGTASMRTQREEMERHLSLSQSAAPDDAMLEGFAWGSRGLLAMLNGDPNGAIKPFSRGMAIYARLPHAEPAALRAAWPLLLASLGDRRATAAIAEARRLGVGAFSLNQAMLGYAEAILAGRAGDRERADMLVARADRGFANCAAWADLARLCAAETALAGGWGEPRHWLTAAAGGFAERGLSRLAGRCHHLLTAARPNPWATSGVTTREADVLRLVAGGLTNKEIAARLHLSPRTVEKHVESLLRKTGARTRTELAVAAASPERQPHT
ncbi:MAG TPA: BREX system ATP-binding domain-containing protein [Streptosporangiaceae bacterium]